MLNTGMIDCELAYFLANLCKQSYLNVIVCDFVLTW